LDPVTRPPTVSALPLAALLLASSLIAGCYVEPPPPARVAVAAPASPEVLVTVRPPAPRYEVVPVAPGGQVVWDPGHWRWSGAGYVWLPGHYVRRPTQYAEWIPGRWVDRPGGWVWAEGHWRA
jgi:hypothetical protein